MRLHQAIFFLFLAKLILPAALWAAQFPNEFEGAEEAEEVLEEKEMGTAAQAAQEARKALDKLDERLKYALQDAIEHGYSATVWFFYPEMIGAFRNRFEEPCDEVCVLNNGSCNICHKMWLPKTVSHETHMSFLKRYLDFYDVDNACCKRKRRLIQSDGINKDLILAASNDDFEFVDLLLTNKVTFMLVQNPSVKHALSHARRKGYKKVSKRLQDYLDKPTMGKCKPVIVPLPEDHVKYLQWLCSTF